MEPTKMDKMQETGKRTLIRCVLPEGGDEISASLYDLETALARVFGGFTCYHMTGGWRDDAGVVIEHGHVWEVSFEPHPELERDCIAIFEKAGRDLAQTWLHIEKHEFEANHIKLR
jgi:hypothetical protein